MSHQPSSASDQSTPAARPAETKKDRPTPKRRQAEAARRRGVLGQDRKSARKASREQLRAERAREYDSLRAGDERHYPPKDRGPVRGYVRDYVDARYNVGEYFLVVAFVLMLGALVFQVINTTLALFVSVVMLLLVYVMMFATVLDSWLMWRRLRSALVAKFGPSSVARGSGTAWYALGRAFQLRRMRLPRPRHAKHGVFPG